MISAELNHNPYLLLTTVKFNGQPPRINSQIEKYEHQPLKDWVRLVPSIFYNEMNGYDFDLYFIGTKSDFEEVVNSFEAVNVTSEQVKLIQKNEIEDPDTKSAEIDALLSWIREHPNRKFDYSSFWGEHSELFESAYPYVLIRGSEPEKPEPDISPEKVDGAQELNGTDLTNTPIIIFIEEKAIKQFRHDMDILLGRADIRQEQLFFMIHPMMNREQVTRVISDLGVASPQVVDRHDHEKVMKYIRNYPMTEYIRNAIQIFEGIAGQIAVVLDEENKESEITNAGIHAKIDSLEADIISLKDADEFFVQRDNYAVPETFAMIRQTLAEQIQKWRNRKTKIVGDNEADTAAEDYVSYLKKCVDVYTASMLESYEKAYKAISADFDVVYSHAGIDTGYRPENVKADNVMSQDFPIVKTDLTALKKITYEEPKPDLFGLFKAQNTGNVAPLRVATCSLEQWRTVVAEMILPLAENYGSSCEQGLGKYYNDLAEAYHSHLTDLIQGKMQEKELVSAHLSDDERRLQEDNDWLAALKEQLQTIERG